MKPARVYLIATAVIIGCLTGSSTASDVTVRVATYNTSLFRNKEGQLIKDLEAGDNEQARKIAEVIQRVRPDILLLNEFDYDGEFRRGGMKSQAAELFRSKYLAVGQNGCAPIEFKEFYTAPVNTGRRSYRDLNHDGKDGPDDAIGFGRHEGQYGMVVFTNFAVGVANYVDPRYPVRTFQKFLWRDMPNALLPIDPKTGKAYYDDLDTAVLRLSSKSFWDVPIGIPDRSGNPEYVIHLLCSHPTPPVFDGPEDRNGRRNHDEIRMIADYIDPKKSEYLVDDNKVRGGLFTHDAMPDRTPGPGGIPLGQFFVIVGDLNCDPVDGAGMRGAMEQLLKSPHVNASFIPTSEGGPLVVKQHPEQFKKNHGNPSHVTADFTPEKHGCLRIDYALPSRGLEVVKGGIFWPTPGQPGAEAITATDHHAVWIDVRPKTESP